jgi:DNA-binding transcriptional regulator YdaS (Cro superfamily)
MDDLITWLDSERGRRKALAEHLGVGQNSLSQWKAVPPKLVRAVEAFTGISRYSLSPDVFGDAPDASAEDRVSA